MIYYDKIKVIGSDSSGRSIAVVSLWVDTAASLPAANAYQSEGFILGMGSEGNCIDSGDKYRLDSSGAWQIMQAGTGTYTKAEIDAIVSRIDATEAEDRAALVELVDAGAKNIADISQTTFTTNTKDGVTVTRTDDTFTVTGTGGTSTNNFFNVYYSPNTIFIPSGVWTFYLVGTGLADIRLEVSDDVSPDVQKGSYGENPFICTVPDGITRSHFRICTRAGASFTDTSFKVMICSPPLWNISNKYQPYCPTMQELYQMILALQ